MKKIRWLLICILLISLCACSSSSVKYTIDKNGKSYVVDTENGSIFDGDHTYQYSFSGDSSSYRIEITYPDGSSYWSQMSGYVGTAGSSDGYDQNRYVDGDILCDVLLEKAPRESNSGKTFGGIFLGAVGLFISAFPYAAWYLEYGWRYKDAEPSDLALGLTRAGGVVVIIIAIVMLVL